MSTKIVELPLPTGSVTTTLRLKSGVVEDMERDSVCAVPRFVQLPP